MAIERFVACSTDGSPAGSLCHPLAVRSWLPLLWLLTLAACGAEPDTTETSDAPVDRPPAPDLRFHWVGTSRSFLQERSVGVQWADGDGGIELATTGPYSWTPLMITLSDLVPAHYAWTVADFRPVETLEPVVAVARTGRLADFEDAVAPHLGGDDVIVSLDVQPDAFAFVTNGATRASGYAPTSIDTARAGLDAWVASEGAAGRVVTAVSLSPTAGMIRAYAFAYAGDTTAYETRVLDASAATVEERARELSAGGYVITAFGRVGDDAAVLIGTRTSSAAPRVITVQTGFRGVPDLSGGDAVVAWVLRDPEPLLILQR